MDKKMTGLNIKAVSERTGISLQTLRAWERRYGVPHPARVPGNRYRAYDEKDIADVLWMKRQVEAGVSPARASAMLQVQEKPAPASRLAPAQPLIEKQSVLLAALLRGDESSAQKVLDEACALFSPEQIALQIIQPILHEIGEQWLANKITVWQEHVASNIIRQRLLSMVQAQPALAYSAPRLIAACAPEEQHEIGLLILALLARRQGWHVVYLGQRTPLRDLARFTDTTKLIVLSVSTSTGLASLIPLLLPNNRPSATLVFGGQLFNQAPTLREHIPGAFLGTDAQEAVRNLVTSETRVMNWSPAPRALNAALTLQAERLKLGWETIVQMTGASRTALRAQRAQQLSNPTLFLIDTLASALAFDIPELMSTQGAWVRQMLSACGGEREMLEPHVASFTRASQQLLSKEVLRQVEPLLARLQASAVA